MEEGMTQDELETLFKIKTLGEAPINFLDAISMNIQCACEVAVFLCLKRDEDDDRLSDREMMIRCQRIIWNMSCEALRRKLAPNRAKLFFLRDLPLFEIDVKIHHIDHREVALGLGYLFREKTGIEVNEEVSCRLYLECLRLFSDR